MAIAVILATLAVVFAAFCVWLTVRIINRRERLAKWMLIGLFATGLVGYPLSFAPAYRFGLLHGFSTNNWTKWQDDIFWTFYRPLVWGRNKCPMADYLLLRYEQLWGLFV